MYVLILIVTLTSAYGDGGQALQTERVGYFQTKKSCDDSGADVSSVQRRDMAGVSDSSHANATLVTSHKCVFVEGK
ncbi:hypothetical protein TROPICALSUN_82 [Erwinia phage vB_EamM_TropicalSun]|uniref:Uncharacterized protein n=3 Tax=Myosmarvirus TaxID=2843428 RepID=A0A5B9NM14_9CAUD|nr:hypothetical protein HWC56_gp012 [Serratia phage MyoSmar]QEG09461.1 hypothetical protein CPT_MyoSmar_012 [Serratia phage MyoSmar]QEG13872.1 hypothetical protein TROPICALSUN_82 [Erwinia phage vB_EamM_TropicalSun]